MYRYGEGRPGAEEEAADDRRGNRGDNHIAEGADLQITHQHFDGEHHPGDRGVEGSSNAGGGAAAHQVSDAVVREAQHLTNTGTKGRADLDDGPLATCRPPGADAERRGDNLGRRNSRPYSAAPDDQGLHYLRDTVPLGFLGKENERADQQTADNRDDEVDEITQPGQQVRQNFVAQVLDPVDQLDEQHRSKAGSRTDGDGENEQQQADRRGQSVQVFTQSCLWCWHWF